MLLLDSQGWLNISCAWLAWALLRQTHAQSIASKGVQVLGRVQPDKVDLSWSATGIEFSFQGTSATISVAHVNSTNYLALLVDDIAPRYVTISPTSETASLTTGKLSNDTHRVIVRKLNEGETGQVHLEDVKVDGKMLAAGKIPARRIEFVGDSITCAYGILKSLKPARNSEVTACLEAAYEDPLQSYAALTAGASSADYSIVAWSGLGLLRNGPGGNGDKYETMPHMYTRWTAFAKDDSYTYPSETAPHAIVIALGTNDFARISYDGTNKTRSILDMDKFKATYIDFIKLLRSKYADVQIFICNSPMLSDTYPSDETQHSTLGDALADIAKGLSYVTAVDFPVQDTNAADLGCDYHPGPSQHKKMADTLAPIVKKALKW